MGTAPATHSLTAPTVNALVDGLHKGEFVPFFSFMGFSTNQCWKGVETLIRCPPPSLELIQPDSFNMGTEQSGLILDPGAFELKAASQQMVQWRKLGLP